jgi:O-antigen/teichoic acid export membrane protein
MSGIDEDPRAEEADQSELVAPALPPAAGLPNDADAAASELSYLPDPEEIKRLEDRRAQLVERHGRSLRQHAARGALINTGFMVGLSVLTFIRGFALAHFLSTSDYGVWGLLAVSLGTLLWLKQVGIGDKYLQQNDPDQETAFQKAFTLELMVNGLFMLLLAAVLPLFALVYGQSEIILPGLVILIVLPAGALQAPLWIYYRNMEFVKQRVIQAIDPCVGFVVAMSFAAAGAGYWALAAGVIAGAWSAAITTIIFSPYKLRLRFDGGTLRSYASFSVPLFLANGSSVVIAQSAVLVGEAKLGLAGIGVIALASNITSFTQRVDGLITGSLYPAVVAARDRLTVLGESFVKSNRLALMWAMPFGVGLSLFCGDLVHFGLGDKWQPAVLLLQVTGVTAAVGHLAFNWDAYMRAVNNTRAIMVASFASMVTFVVIGLPLIWWYGLRGLAIGTALQMLANLVCRIFYLRRLFQGFSAITHASRAILPSVPAVAVVLLMRLVESGTRTLELAVAELVIYLGVTAAATWWSEKSLLREAIGYVMARRATAPAG